MKHFIFSLSKVTIFLLAFSACADNVNEETYEPLSHIYITAKDFKLESEARTTFNITSSGAEFSWAENDTIGIFPETGAQAYFPMSSGAGTKSASFTGGGWALKPSAIYVAYFPLIGRFYLDKEAIPLDYTGQKQMENSKTDHLGQYDFMAAPASSSTDGYVNFKFDHLGCLVQLKLTVPVAATFSTLTLSSDEAIFTEKAKLNLVGENYSYTPTSLTKRLTMTLDDISSDTENQILTFYMMVGPADMTNHSVTVTLHTDADELYQGQLTSKNMLAGYAYAFSSTLEATNLEYNVIAPDFGDIENEI